MLQFVRRAAYADETMLGSALSKRCVGGKQSGKESAVAVSFYKNKVAERGEELVMLSVNVARSGHVPQARQRITALRTIVCIHLQPAYPVWSRDLVTCCARTRATLASIDALHTSLIEAISVEMSEDGAKCLDGLTSQPKLQDVQLD